MSTRYYAETPCEHGKWNAHYLDGFALTAGTTTTAESCPGGTRRELTRADLLAIALPRAVEDPDFVLPWNDEAALSGETGDTDE